MEATCMLTTIDNPYDPFEKFDEWLLYDNLHGYNTSGYLDRIAKTSNQYSDEENNIEIERAIDEIIKFDFRNIYKKVWPKNIDKTKKVSEVYKPFEFDDSLI
jgi:hypothetical protein